jgi:outer membrane protein
MADTNIKIPNTSKEPIQANDGKISSIVIAVLISLIGALAISFGVFFWKTPRIAYVNTSKLMIGFSEAAKIDHEIKAEEDKIQAQLKLLQDTLQGTVDNMSKTYDNAPPAKKKELQDLLSARNQQINNFRQASTRRMDELRQKNMQGVIDKINVFLGEYGKKHSYTLIFGTMTGGNILYGNEAKYDITEDIIKGLNARYK